MMRLIRKRTHPPKRAAEPQWVGGAHSAIHKQYTALFTNNMYLNKPHLRVNYFTFKAKFQIKVKSSSFFSSMTVLVG